jgi:predicted RNase H-like HicB family nuclease
MPSTMKFEIEQEDDGRWIAEAMHAPGAMCYGDTPQDALAKVLALLDQLQHGGGAVKQGNGG